MFPNDFKISLSCQVSILSEPKIIEPDKSECVTGARGKGAVLETGIHGLNSKYENCGCSQAGDLPSAQRQAG